MSISFKVTGLDEITRSIDTMGREIPYLRTAVLNEAARFFINEAKKNVHVVTGRLKNSISIDIPPNANTDHVIVSAKTPYARVENERPGEKHPGPGKTGPFGPHDYFTKAILDFEANYTSRIKIGFDALFTKRKV